MNFLIIHQHFNTPDDGGALRSYFLAKALVENGDQVQILTGTNKGRYYQQNVEGIEVHYLPVAYANRFGFWQRIYSFLQFVLLSIRISKKFRDVDLVYAISVPLTVGLAARWMKWRYGTPYIFEVGDLWPDAAIQLDVIQNPWLKNMLWRMERKIYQEAQSIVALSPAIGEAILKKSPTKTVFVVPNMSDCRFFIQEPKDQNLLAQNEADGKLVISYFGAMGFANGLEYLLECAHLCEAAQLPVIFILVGDGAEKENLKMKAESLHLKNLSFQDFRNRDGIKKMMNISDVVFVSYRPATILETGSPNKFFDGLAAGKMIVINFKGWIKDEIENGQCGFYVDPKLAADFVEKVKGLLASRKLEEYKKNSRLLAESKFSREKLTRFWMESIRSGRSK